MTIRSEGQWFDLLLPTMYAYPNITRADVWRAALAAWNMQYQKDENAALSVAGKILERAQGYWYEGPS